MDSGRLVRIKGAARLDGKGYTEMEVIVKKKKRKKKALIEKDFFFQHQTSCRRRSEPLHAFFRRPLLSS